MKTVFADSFYFFALLNPRAPAHSKAVAFTQTYSGRIATTGWVLTELADGWARPVSWRSVFVQLLADLRANANIAVVACTDQLLDEGISLYAQRPDKGMVAHRLHFVRCHESRASHRGADRRSPLRTSRFRGFTQMIIISVNGTKYPPIHAIAMSAPGSLSGLPYLVMYSITDDMKWAESALAPKPQSRLMTLPA
jgi:hypothetical protein